MKVLNAKYYKRVGVLMGLHLFVSIRRDFDPEILLLSRAKLVFDDGTAIYYDKLDVADRDKVIDSTYIYDGFDSDGSSFTIPIQYSSDPFNIRKVYNNNTSSSAACVKHLEQEGRIPRKIVKYSNLIK